MAALATLQELRDFLQDPNVPADTGNLMLASASGLVRTYTHRTFDAGDTTVRLNGTGTRVLLLPDLPVTAVTSIVEDPDGAATALVDGTDFEWSSDGIVRSLVGVFARRFRWYVVTYSHVAGAELDTVKAVVLAAAARGVTNPEGLRSETIGKYAWTAGGEAGGLGLYAAELRFLDRLSA